MGKTILPISDLIKMVQYSRPYTATKEELGGLRQVIDAHNRAHNAELQLLPTADSTNKAMQAHGMISGNAFEAKQASPKAFDTPEIRYLQMPDASGTLPKGQVRGNAVFVPPYSGMFQDEDALKEASLYLQGLGSLGGGAGKAMLGKLQEMYPRARMQLQSLEDNGTPEFYKSIGMQPLPQKPGGLPEFYIDAMDDLQLKAQGGVVKMGKGGYTEEKPYTSLAGLTPVQYAKYMRLAAADDAQKARELQNRLFEAQQAKMRADYQRSYQDQNDSAAAQQRLQDEPGIDFRAASAEQLASQKAAAGQAQADKLSRQYPSIGEGQARRYNPHKLEEALAVSPVAALQGLARGSLAGPAFLADIAALPYNLVSGATGHAENMTPDMFKASTDWLSKNVPGLGRSDDEMASAVGSLGEMVGMGIKPLTAAGNIGRAVARPFRSTSELSTIRPDALLLPSPNAPMLPAPRTIGPSDAGVARSAAADAAYKATPERSMAFGGPQLPEKLLSGNATIKAELAGRVVQAQTPEEKAQLQYLLDNIDAYTKTPEASYNLQRDLDAALRRSTTPKTVDNQLAFEGMSEAPQRDPMSMAEFITGQRLNPDELSRLDVLMSTKPATAPGYVVQPQLFAEGGAPKKSIWSRRPTSEMTHFKSSGHMDPVWQRYMDSTALPGKGITEEPGLEAPMLDPMDPFLLPKTLPAAIAKRVGKAAAKAVAQGVEGYGPLGQILQGAQPQYVVKPKGGNWLSGSVEDALSGLKTGPGPDAVNALRRANPNISAAEAAAFIQANQPIAPESKVINNWIEGPLTKYVKTRMASPDDEVRKLAEQGVLHYNLDTQPRRMNAIGGVWDKRQEAGFPAMQGTSRLAQNWEAHADDVLKSRPMSDYQNFGPSNLGEDWVQKLDPKTAMYMPEQRFREGIARGTEEGLGFPHLIDELKNALNPESGLPRNLLLTPEAVQNMSMEKAVRRVADINAWRAAQMANARLESMAGRPVIRDYTHAEETPNPKGLRWVQLGKEGDFVAESDAMGHSVRGYEPPHLGGSSSYGLGGWGAIKSGKAKVYSLQDAKGEPHVTVEVKSVPAFPDWLKQEHGIEFKGGVDEQTMLQDPEVMAAYQDYLANPPQPRIVQIKGKQNRAPNEEYLPFVQDFVKNPPHGGTGGAGGGWSDVGDLQNTGLKDVHSMNLGDQALPEQRFMTPEELSNYIKSSQGNFASGGYVPLPGTETATTGTRGHTVEDLHRIIAELEAA